MNIFVRMPDGLHRLRIKQFGKTLIVRTETVPFARELAVNIASMFGKDAMVYTDAIGLPLEDNNSDDDQPKARRIGFTMEES